ncbi:hypothetical protein QP166_12865 [Sphingomonas sp. LR60]|uniref:hypothetical protein n=1 Tax=Sphingomonas sp. LR60 TaxID=3050233 RepID=UPI002FE2824B
MDAEEHSTSVSFCPRREKHSTPILRAGRNDRELRAHRAETLVINLAPTVLKNAAYCASQHDGCFRLFRLLVIFRQGRGARSTR